MKKLDIHVDPLPKHVAIIMDGNGRWAKKRLMPRSFGHRAGMENVTRIVRFCSDLGIHALTLYAFSTENWKRPKDEVNVLMSLLIEYLRKELNELHKEGVVFKVIGDMNGLPNEVQKVLKNAENVTRDNAGLNLIVAVNYGSRAEILDAVRKTAEQLRDGAIDCIDEKVFESNLQTAGVEDPDLVIRTSGEQRISNFLLYQMAYSELYFTDVMWPDFREEELLKALREYERRNRRFGGI